MSAITRAEFNTLTDQLVGIYLRAKGETGGTYGVGELGVDDRAVAAVLDLKAAVLALADLEGTVAIAPAVQTLASIFYTDGIIASLLSPTLQAITTHLLQQGYSNVNSLDTYLTAYNITDATKWQVLQHPAFRNIHYSVIGSYPSVNNLYFEILQSGTYLLGLGRLVGGGAFTAGASVDGTKYAGASPQIKGVTIAGGPVTITVTGTAYDPATQAFATGKTWQASLNNGDSTVALAPGGGTPAAADSLIAATSGISGGGPFTGTVYVEAARPSGRPLLP